MTPDSINQFEQVLRIIPYSNHHPWVHTLLIGLFYHIGYGLTGNMVIGMSFYTFFQMCMLALSVAYLINTLKQYLVKPAVCLPVILFYALVPYHAVFSVTVWKDILFAAGVMFFGCSMLRLMKKIFLPEIIVFILSGITLCLFRSNGWYAFCLCLPFLLFHFRKQARIFFPALFGIFIFALLVKYPVMKAFQVSRRTLWNPLPFPPSK